MDKKIITISREFGSGGRTVGHMVAEKLGIRVFLLTDCMINKANADISVYPHGSFDDLKNFLNTL